MLTAIHFFIFIYSLLAGEGGWEFRHWTIDFHKSARVKAADKHPNYSDMIVLCLNASNRLDSDT